MSRIQKQFECSVNLFSTTDKDEIYPLYVSKEQKKYNHHINLMVIEEYDEEAEKMNCHCIYINDIN